MSGDIKAIPTVYNGVHFRSRLEAKWGAFFDVLGWRWEYEPIDLAGYIPDFLVWQPEARERLIEVKPALKFTDYEPAQRKIESSGWTRDASCVGATLGIDDECAVLGVEWVDCEFWVPWFGRHPTHFHEAWREAANRVQWKKGQLRARPRSEESVPYAETVAFFQGLRAEWENE